MFGRISFLSAITPYLVFSQVQRNSMLTGRYELKRLRSELLVDPIVKYF